MVFVWRLYGGTKGQLGIFRTRACFASICFITAARQTWPRAVKSVIEYKTRTAHNEALIVRGTGYDVDHLDQPRASLSLRGNPNLNALRDSCDRMYL